MKRRRLAGDLLVVATGLALCAALAFFLTPTAQTSSLSLVMVNGQIFALPPGATSADLPAFSALLARPGSTLNLTGDVIEPGAGTAPLRQSDGRPVSGTWVPADGELLSVRQGGHVLEPLKRVTQSIGFGVSVVGSGSIVTLAQPGAPGEREIFKGVSSNKQAAVFVVTEPEDRLLQRSNKAESGQKLVALTFDDGPGTHTQEVLDALAAAHVPATFFVLGSSAASNKTMIKKMRAAGHEIENHTWDHPDLTKITESQFRSEVSRTSTVIGGSRYLRPPYGSSDATVKKLAASMGVRLAFWTVDTLDWLHQDVDSIMQKVRSATKPGAIILMHDGGANRLQTVAAIPVVVDWLFAHGYSITTVEHILD